MTVALCVLWVRSHRFRDELYYRYWPSRVLEIVSMESRVEFVNGDPISDLPHWFNSHTHSEWKDPRWHNRRGFYGNQVGAPFRVAIPHYVVIIMAASIAALPWFNRIPRHFSLRALLIATTLVAVVLGLIVWATR